MRIAVCDDEAVFRDALTDHLSEYQKRRRVPLDVREFDSGEALLADGQSFDLVFLDYQMKEASGMDTARALRERNCLCRIVFATNYPDFVFESFEVNPFRFFRKPVAYADVEAALDAVVREEARHAPLLLRGEDGLKTVHSRDIVYLEGDGKCCTVRTVNGTEHCAKTLSAVLALLPQSVFYRIHKSYAVNLYYVDRIEDSTVYLTNGEKAAVGRSKAAEFKRAYRDFVKDCCVRF